ncbi:MAG: gamma-glutamyl-gamma-aminobutyrate hydrolase family protein [Candidatus Aminicenantes bacterium]|nr:gamma-glutamyl-gamma-aminobutyrate hydrolase family protein [Candidatus Aminicenantes bacterium]
MLLVADTFVSDAFAATFDRLMAAVAEKGGSEVEFWRPLRQPGAPDLCRCSRLILSGSETSIVDNHPWEEPLVAVLDGFLGAGKPVLGICHGHQFIVKRLLGRRRIRHAPVPEFGYRRIEFTANPLFAGIREPLVSVVSHFDEVTDLEEEFAVLASSPDCPVQAFQLKGRPVWGVQFHPEYGPGSIEEIFADVEKSFPEYGNFYHDDLRQEADLEQNERIFLNFLEM